MLSPCPSNIAHNVRDIRSFSGTKWKKNLGEGRAESRTVYPLLNDPSVAKRNESAAWCGTKWSKLLNCPYIRIMTKYLQIFQTNNQLRRIYPKLDKFLCLVLLREEHRLLLYHQHKESLLEANPIF